MRKVKYRVSANESLNDIASSVSAEVRGKLKDEMSERIEKEPETVTVDYSVGEVKAPTPKNADSFDPYKMYSHTTSDGKITAAVTTPERKQSVREIYPDGTEQVSSAEDYAKKRESQMPTESEVAELGRIVRISSADSDSYKNAESRSKHAYDAFNTDKYMIEETAGRIGVPAALLSSVYFKKIADTGSPLGALSLKYARLSYNRLYGTKLSWSDETLGEYLKTPQGILDFTAIFLKSDADYHGMNIYRLSDREMAFLLNNFSERNEESPRGFTGTVMAYNDVFEKIFKKMPDRRYDVG